MNNLDERLLAVQVSAIPPDTISARLLKVALAVVDIASVVFGGSVEVAVTDVIVVVDVLIMDIQVLFKFSTKNM